MVARRLCTYWLSGRAGQENIWLEVRTYATERSEVRTSWPRDKYFPVRPDLTQLQKDSTIKTCHVFLRVEQETHNSSKNTTHFLIFVFYCKSTITIHAKKPTESWHKAVKNMSKPSKTEWQKFASRFTEIIHKSSSEDLRKCRRRFKLFVDSSIGVSASSSFLQSIKWDRKILHQTIYSLRNINCVINCLTCSQIPDMTFLGNTVGLCRDFP